MKVQNHKSVQMEGSNRAFCNRCNCFIALESSGDDFFISNKKQHQCQLDKCAICQEHLGYLSERDKVRFRIIRQEAELEIFFLGLPFLRES